MRIATWNVNSLAVRLPQVLDWLATNPVDVLCLQELKLSDDKFPLQALEAAGYHCAVFGQKTYNGVALLSRTPARDVVKNITGFSDEQSRVIAATFDIPGVTAGRQIRVVNGYFVNGQAPGSEKFAYKMKWLDGLRNALRVELAAHSQLALLGDFNITVDDRDTYDPEGLRETIHHTTEERQHFQALIDLGLTDAFRMFEQPEKSYSWWDYREFGFRRNRGLRIDHILVSEALKPTVKSCVIDKLPRKNERPSDHAPVTVELDL
ncbi:MAG: exodeoxyribonuclease III [Pseudomonadota bacterium]